MPGKKRIDGRLLYDPSAVTPDIGGSRDFMEKMVAIGKKTGKGYSTIIDEIIDAGGSDAVFAAGAYHLKADFKKSFDQYIVGTKQEEINEAVENQLNAQFRVLGYSDTKQEAIITGIMDKAEKGGASRAQYLSNIEIGIAKEMLEDPK